jgi:RNA polymerase sigma-70 factor (ECF subfamily)
MFEEFVLSQQARLLRLCAGILSDSAEAQDAAQEVFVKAYRAWESFRGESSRETWVYRIAVRHCVDRLRGRTRYREIFSAEDETDPSGTAVADVLSAETRLAAREVLAALPEGDRTILALREIEGLSYEELAQVLEVSVEAVRSRLARARRALARLWEKRLQEGS